MSRFNYEVKRNKLNSYRNYLSSINEKISDFSISMSLKHVLGLIKICDLVDGKVTIILIILTNI